MTRYIRSRTWFVVASAILLVALVSAGTASASNMAWKLNKQIWKLGSGAQGTNIVALPDISPYAGAGGLTALCNALNLSTSGQLIQFEADTGNIRTFTCGQVETFTLLPGVGVLINDTIDTGGVMVGADIPGNSFDISILGPSPFGLNLWNLEYHTTAQNAEDVCQQCGLSNTATVTQFDAQTGNVCVHTCGQIPVCGMPLGEALLIQEDQANRVCTPAHF
jgi:hypothetical protein